MMVLKWSQLSALFAVCYSSRSSYWNQRHSPPASLSDPTNNDLRQDFVVQQEDMIVGAAVGQDRSIAGSAKRKLPEQCSSSFSTA